MTDKTKQQEALEALEELVEFAAHKQGGIGFRDVMDLGEVVRQALQFDPEAVIKEIEGEIKDWRKSDYDCGLGQAISIIRKHMNQEGENK